MEKYGPFANIAAIALALVALFSMLLLKALGSVKKWTWLTDDSPSFLVTAGPRALTVVLMAVAYLTASTTNQTWFVVAAVLCGVLCLVLIAYFDRQRRTYVVGVPLVGPNGELAGTKNVVIGTEKDLMPAAKKALAKARKKSGGVSLPGFMSGYGATEVNDPGALWERTLLARNGSRLSLTLTGIVLFAVLSLFLAALIVDVSLR